MTLKEARYLKKLRLKLGWKQEYVAYKLNISAALYGEIERNVSKPSGDISQRINLLFDFSTNVDIISMRAQLKELFLSIYYCKANSSKLYEALKCQKSKYDDSILFIEYWLCIYVYQVTKKIQVKECYEFLKTWERYLTEDEKHFFNLYHSIQLRNEDKVTEAIHNMEILLGKKQTNIYFEAILHYHAAALYYGQGNFIESYKMTIRAKVIFKETFCEARFLMIRCHEANIYMMTALHEQADNIYKDLIETAKDKILEIDYNVTVCNAAYNMIQVGNYQKALNYLNQRTPSCSELPHFHFNYVWALYKTDQQDVALNYIKNNLDKVKDPYLRRSLQIVKCLIEDPMGAELLRRLKECEKYLNNTATDRDGYLFINNLLLEYYQRKGNKQQLIKILKKRISLN